MKLEQWRLLLQNGNETMTPVSFAIGRSNNFCQMPMAVNPIGQCQSIPSMQDIKWIPSRTILLFFRVHSGVLLRLSDERDPDSYLMDPLCTWRTHSVTLSECISQLPSTLAKNYVTLGNPVLSE